MMPFFCAENKMRIQNVIHEVLTQHKLSGINKTAQELNMVFELTENPLQLHLYAGFPVVQAEQWSAELSALISAQANTTVTVNCTTFIRPHLTQFPGQSLRGVKNTIAVASGKGGVGKSTVTVNLAAALAKMGARVGILDADIYGPSIPLMLGQSAPVAMQDSNYLPVKAHGIQAMSIGYLTHGDQALIWRGPMLAKSLMQLINITLWDELDYLFIDLPPGTGDIQLSLVQKIPLSGAVVVTTPQNVATLDAQKAIKMFERTNINVLGLVENMALHECSNCGHHDAIFGSGGAERLSAEFGIPLLGQLPLQASIRADGDAGMPSALSADNSVRQMFEKVALNTAIALAQRDLNTAKVSE